MANETNRTVTISADYFAELYHKAKNWASLIDAIKPLVKERDELRAANEDLKSRVVSDAELKHFAKLEDDYIAASKERNELKAALDTANANNSAQAEQLRDALNEIEAKKALYSADHERMDAAERCIEDIANNF